MAQNKPRQPRKTWFDNQAERKGQRFLDGWANGQDRDFILPDRKIRAIDNILRDIKDGQINPIKDITPTRLLNKDLLYSITQVCKARLDYFKRMYNAFIMLDSVSYCVLTQKRLYELTEGITDVNEKMKYLEKIGVDRNYIWLVGTMPLDGAYDPATNTFKGGIPYARELQQAHNHPAYQTQIWMAERYKTMYETMYNIFSKIYDGVAHNTLEQSDTTFHEQIKSAMNNAEEHRFANGMKVPLDFNVMTGYDYML